MATTKETVNVTDEQRAALQEELEQTNAQIEARNRVIEAQKSLAQTQGVPYNGPEPEPLRTIQQLVQDRFDGAVQQDQVNRLRRIAHEFQDALLTSDPATQAQMIADFRARHPTVQPPAPSRRGK